MGEDKPLVPDVATMRADYEAASNEMDRLTSSPGGPGHAWRWSIPANPDRDSDLIFDRALRHLPGLLDRLEVAEAALARARTLAADWSAQQVGTGLVPEDCAADLSEALDGQP